MSRLPMQLRAKLDHRNARLPQKAHELDAAYDLWACDHAISYKHDFIEYDTGVCLDIPQGYMGLVFPRSSISKMGLTLCNSVGIIDPGYRGRIKVRCRRNSETNKEVYKKGERIAQLVVLPTILLDFEQVDTFDDTTERGQDGFGSSGRD